MGGGFLDILIKTLTIFIKKKTKFNYGVIIILMTIIVKLILFPITYWQCKFIAIMKMRRSEIEELNEKLKDADPLQKQQATSYYRILETNRNKSNVWIFPSNFTNPNLLCTV